jgi:poly(3-hydroxybutyrate) depolymerase
MPQGTGGTPGTPTGGDAGSMAGGTGGVGGDSSTGGTVGGGGSPEVAGMGGTSTDPGTGGKPPPAPSEGCGKMSPQTGSSNSPLNVSSHQYYVKLPTNYDANNPYPVMFMFHPTNNPLNWAEQNAGFETLESKDTWIRVYPGAGNNSAGWGANDVSFFEPLYNTIVADFCVDTERVFASGESSGGDFASILGCEFADLLRATAPCSTKPVNGYPLDANSRQCTGQVAAVVIQGKNDMVVGPENGPLTRDFYKALNHCSDTSQPVEGYTDNLSNCVVFDGCDEGFPTYWCQHEDPEYSNTNHGWPHFAAKMLYETFSQY